MLVHVLDPLAEQMTAEDICMLQALYSRDPATVFDHLEKVRKSGSGKFMGKYYTGYGHKSIADCAQAVVFVEGVSLVAAKAMQHTPLYNGQESSTRYIDFSTAGMVTPFNDPGLRRIQNDQMELYADVHDHVVDQLSASVDPSGTLDDVQIRIRAAHARAFDVARGFLPAGVKTNLSIAMGLHPLSDHLRILSCSPLAEVRDIAKQIWSNLSDSFPNSFGNMVMDEKQDRWHWKLGEAFYYDPHTVPPWAFPGNDGPQPPTFALSVREGHKRPSHLGMEDRPRCAPLPGSVAQSARVHMNYTLDFGSYRDLQRHRRCDHDLAYVQTTSPCHPWYVGHLNEPLRRRHEAILREVALIYRDRRVSHGVGEYHLTLADKLEFQYVCVLGQQVMGEMSMDLGEAAYIAELRSSKTVHPTLRPLAISLGEYLETEFGLAVDIDRSPDAGVVYRRGTQTIVEKE